MDCCCDLLSRTWDDLTLLKHEQEHLFVEEENNKQKLMQVKDLHLGIHCKLNNLHVLKLSDITSDHSTSDPLHMISQFAEFMRNVLEVANDILEYEWSNYMLKISPLAPVLHQVKTNLDEAISKTSQTSCHPQCVSRLYMMYCEMTYRILPRLSASGEILQQSVYFDKMLSLLFNIDHVLQVFIRRPKDYGEKELCDEILRHIEPENHDDAAEPGSGNVSVFSYVVALLTGKLLADEDDSQIIEPLDRTEDVCGDSDLVDNVKDMVLWLLAKYTPDENKWTHLSDVIKMNSATSLDNTGWLKNVMQIDPYDSMPTKQPRLHFEYEPDSAWSQPPGFVYPTQIVAPDSSPITLYWMQEDVVVEEPSKFLQGKVLNEKSVRGNIHFRKTSGPKNWNGSSSTALKPIKIPQLEGNIMQPFDL